MNLGKRNFIFNFHDLNKEMPHTSHLFKTNSRPKKVVKLLLGSWGVIVTISLFVLCGKIALENLALYVAKVLSH